MNIDISILEKSINNVINNILEQLEGTQGPQITERTVKEKLGTISALVITLHDEARELGYSNEELDKIWDLKEKSDNILEELFDRLCD